ncbi:ATP-binding protein [Saccharopolyspora sp. 5N102]|uniref:ATP-binding protein n=1 Tax=Saccharopolyspora sp. 5N102 TaxID=3375155 RepID=UPI00379672B5
MEAPNSLSGTARDVVQARHIGGGIHFHSPPDRWPAPSQIPKRTRHFCGRGTEARALDGLLVGNFEVTKLPVVLISGMAGVGKTTLAVYWADSVRERFPDGNLYVNLRGYDAESPLRPEHVLDSFLRALDVPAERIPLDLDSRAALYRSILNDRCMVIVLDNARTAAQVRPLLPGSGRCAVVITSRNKLSGLVTRDDAHRIELDVLDSDAALDLLRRILGSSQVKDDLAGAEALIDHCASLPLALRIAADRAAAHPQRSLSDLAEELASESNRVEAFTVDEDDASTVRVVFSWSYNVLPAAAQRMFRRLGLHDGTDISLSAAAALTGVTESEARKSLERLVNAHLLEEPYGKRYQFHDLVRAYANGRANAEEPRHERQDAVRRLLTWYLHHADQAARRFGPARRHVQIDSGERTPCTTAPIFTHAEALNWYETERANLLAAVQQAAREGENQLAWKIAASNRPYYHLRKIWNDWINSHQVALSVSQKDNDAHGLAWISNSLGVAYTSFRRFADARRHFTEALHMSQRLGDPYGEALALSCLGDVDWSTKKYNDALEHLDQAIQIWSRLKDRWGTAMTYRGLGRVHRDIGNLGQAAELLRQALEIYRTIDDPWGEGTILADLGRTYLRLEQLTEAIRALQDAVRSHREIGNLWQEAKTLHDLGEALDAGGRPADAQAARGRANDILKDFDRHAVPK